MESTSIKIISKGGLTGETVNQLTNELSKYTFKVMLKYQGTTTIANSSLGVMSLGVPEGAEIQLSVDGTADQLKEVVQTLIDNKFATTV
ncbi:HPr family phosphocarrier protein [Secundilactobacillus folii]|uniref:HPr family phosphocarrier protein n=1 Tax=Secundilactobacillus folii TaxID=2678357 RepID=UPI0012D3A4A7|nr:HPr family phosphocarrier protein [Secundilactobacillus folii]